MMFRNSCQIGWIMLAALALTGPGAAWKAEAAQVETSAEPAENEGQDNSSFTPSDDLFFASLKSRADQGAQAPDALFKLACAQAPNAAECQQACQQAYQGGYQAIMRQEATIWKTPTYVSTQLPMVCSDHSGESAGESSSRSQAVLRDVKAQCCNHGSWLAQGIFEKEMNEKKPTECLSLAGMGESYGKKFPLLAFSRGCGIESMKAGTNRQLLGCYATGFLKGYRAGYADPIASLLGASLGTRQAGLSPQASDSSLKSTVADFGSTAKSGSSLNLENLDTQAEVPQ